MAFAVYFRVLPKPARPDQGAFGAKMVQMGDSHLGQ